jgi:FkbM family methyltransferase
MFGIRLRAGDPVSRDMADTCKHLVGLGFQPTMIIDVGVADGTIDLYKHFDDPYLVLVEPVIEFTASIDAILKRYRGEAHFVAAGPNDGEVIFTVGDSASAHHNSKPAEALADGRHRSVPMQRLDGLVIKPTGDILLKIDVEGYELGVVAGAEQLLPRVEVAILETRFIDVIGGTAIFSDVCRQMAEYGYEVFDIIELTARPLDGALILCDLVFVKADGRFRSDRRYHNDAQAAQHDRRLLPTIRRLLNW